MLGKDLYKIDNSIELSNDKLKSLSLFYRPLIGSHALAIYLHFAYTNISIGYRQLDELLTILNIPVDRFEECLKTLNKYKLVRTLKSTTEDKYIFNIIKPLGSIDFTNNDLLARAFIKNVGGEYYQNLISTLRIPNNHIGFEDVSLKFEKDFLNTWDSNDETYLNKQMNEYKIDTLFDVNYFLKNVSTHLLPMRYRTYENLKAIGNLADLYNISYDKMRTYLPKVASSEKDNFDINLLKMLCENSQSEYKTIEKGKYDVPCLLFLMNLQDGKDVSRYDRQLLYTLMNEYNLKPSVINVLIEYCLRNCDNRIILKYVYALASDLHRNNIDTSNKAIERLDKFNKQATRINTNQSKTSNYDDSLNSDVDLRQLEAFRRNG